MGNELCPEVPLPSTLTPLAPLLFWLKLSRIGSGGDMRLLMLNLARSLGGGGAIGATGRSRCIEVAIGTVYPVQENRGLVRWEVGGEKEYVFSDKEVELELGMGWPASAGDEPVECGGRRTVSDRCRFVSPRIQQCLICSVGSVDSLTWKGGKVQLRRRSKGSDL